MSSADIPTDPRTRRAQQVDRFKALAHPIRLEMVELMRQRDEICICEVVGHFSVSQPTLSHHLKILKEAHLVQSRPDGTRSLWQLQEDALIDLGEWLQAGRHQAPTLQPSSTPETS